jgi:hypothetical protein
MVTATVDRTKYISSSQPSNNIPKQIHKSQPHTNLNSNANEIIPIHKHKVTNKNGDINNLFKIYHQNIWGRKGKSNELTLYLLTEAPHLIFLTEHHLRNFEIDATPISKYKPGAKYCRNKLKNISVLYTHPRSHKIHKHQSTKTL